MLDKLDINHIIKIAKNAGSKALEIYNTHNLQIDYKDDNSPLTKADIQANQIICDNLKKLFPKIPIISEENKQIDYNIRKKYLYYWCIDPIDGTKEFIQKNGEFTINIALIYKNTPVLGVVYAPVLDELYYAKKGYGAFKNNKKLPLVKTSTNKYIITASKSHLSTETKQFINNIKTSKEKVIISKGSSLKLCMIASGEADIYPRLSPTMEWDTAAADAIVRESGKMVYQYNSNIPLQYNKPDLTNPWFIVE